MHSSRWNGVCIFFFLLTVIKGNGSSQRSNMPGHIVMESYLGDSDRLLYVERPWSVKDPIEPAGDISKHCLELLDTFSNATSVYLKCIMCNARPLHYCQNCATEFAYAVNCYSDISRLVENGSRCRDELERADNVQVVTLVYDFIVDVWEKSHCHNCYNATAQNGTTVYNSTEETKEMLEKIQDVQMCFHDFAGKDIENVSVCFLCRELYNKANDYYNMLDKEDKLCSDLEDSMNYTRRMWSKDLHCTVAVHTDLLIYSLSVAISAIPLLFYLGLYMYGRRLVPAVSLSRRDSQRRALKEDTDPPVRASTSDGI